ncbi:MAG: hypothetical protein K2X86_10960 [Cytophagaceae bacterium]|nr:hypothetical protein [Cytophagaceae bacterium]
MENSESKKLKELVKEKYNQIAKEQNETSWLARHKEIIPVHKNSEKRNGK